MIGKTSGIKIVEKIGLDGRIHRNYITANVNNMVAASNFNAATTTVTENRRDS